MSKCRYCDNGYAYHYHDFYDGSGRRKYHHGPDYYGLDPDGWESWECRNQTWMTRHPWLTTTAVGVTLLVSLSILLDWFS